MRYLLSFILRHHFTFLFILLEVIAVWLVVNHSFYQHSRVTGMISEMTGSVQTRINSVYEYLHLKKVNESLAMENALLRSKLKESYLLTDTMRFYQSDTANKQEYSYLYAKVISNDVKSRSNYLMLNKGSRHGIRTDMAVISPDGIVGIVSKVSSNFCWVNSMLHKQTRISARIRKNGFVGTITWDGMNHAYGRLQDIPANVQLSKGDTVVTSGYSHIFPPNLMIGTIADYRVAEGYNFYDISLKFSQEYNRLSWVYVVTDFYRDEKIYLERFRVDE
ncbi:MAG TPA: rod shape-determining protein MreC [Bacteroidales bacterium]|nr:rod shape-determining protein MreC [Bacteroidales bacterium]HSA43090.1 rod shape-determining protein MreC [Bacteroidales bacterium]